MLHKLLIGMKTLSKKKNSVFSLFCFEIIIWSKRGTGFDTGSSFAFHLLLFRYLSSSRHRFITPFSTAIAEIGN